MSKYTTKLSQLQFDFPEVQLCECGCGQPAPIAKYNDKRRGWIKGKPIRFISGHNNYHALMPTIPPNLSGLCECGCGESTPIAKQTRASCGHVRGHHVRFITGHEVRVRVYPSLQDRFWEKVDKWGDGDSCWHWTGCRNGQGYGVIKDAGKTHMAHRVSWEMHNDPVPDGLYVLHECDNPPCVNPAHLFVGTHQDNMADMAAKGRSRGRWQDQLGEKNPCSKLTSDDVAAIRKLHREGYKSRDLASRYGVSQGHVNSVISGRCWKHIP